MGGWRGFGLARMRLWIGRGRGRFWEPGWCGFDDVDCELHEILLQDVSLGMKRKNGKGYQTYCDNSLDAGKTVRDCHCPRVGDLSSINALLAFLICFQFLQNS